MASGLPWMQGRQGYFDNVTIIDAYDSVVAEVQMAPREAAVDAANDIVRAVNAHDALVAALERMREIGADFGDGAPDSSACAKMLLEVEDIARAALAVARGEGA